LHKYICGDEAIRKKVKDAIKASLKMEGQLNTLTPEAIVGAGGLTLWVYLVQSVPALGMVGAPVIAGIVVILYVLGVKAFCQWSGCSGSDETEEF
jgi:hypothetical protein